MMARRKREFEELEDEVAALEMRVLDVIDKLERHDAFVRDAYAGISRMLDLGDIDGAKLLLQMTIGQIEEAARLN